jgi:hypothetical protein
MKKPGVLLVIIFILFSSNLRAEYRAYLLEVYDHILKKQWEERSGFSPDKYVLSHGGGNRLSVYVKATWVCYGDTSNFQPACPLPEPKKPLFKQGDWVKINLEKHITEGWIGEIELVYYQADIKSNVYGVRFGQKTKLYNRYFEFNLEKSTPPTEVQVAPSP